MVYRRQVLPPIPGYIPVYIQHGDVPPEDPHHYAQLFQVADKIAPPRVSPTMHFPTTTTEMPGENTTQPPADSDTTTAVTADVTSKNDMRLSEETTTEISANTVPDANDGYTPITYEPEMSTEQNS